MWVYNLNEALTRQHRIDEYVRIIDYPSIQYQFNSTLQNVLKKKYEISQDVSLSKMHEHMSIENLSTHLQSSGHWYDHLTTLGDELVRVYHAFIRWLSLHLGFDFIFERDPLVRYHIPGRLDDRYRLDNGELFTFHSDTLLGDYFQQINVWLPFCDVKDTAALTMVDPLLSLEALQTFSESIDFCSITYRAARVSFFEFMKQRDDLSQKIFSNSKSMNMKYGQCLLFDPRVLHGTAENISDETRVSMDFRIVPLKDYQKIMTDMQHQQATPDQYEGDQLIKGQFYHVLSAHELPLD